VLRWAAAHAALGKHDGSAVGPPASARLPPALPGSCWVAPPAAKRRLGALLSSDDYGSSVERAAKLHPLWRMLKPVARRVLRVGGVQLASSGAVGWLSC
jgi:hypothetical protein